MEFSEIVMKRYATKKFDGRLLPQEKVEQLFELIRLAPTSLNLQPYVVKVVTDANVKAELSKASYNQPQIESCSHLLVFCADTDLESHSEKLGRELSNSGMPADALKGYLGMVNGFISSLPKEARLPWAQRQLYIALGNAVNGAKSLGFDSCPMEGFDPAAYSRILSLPEHIVPTALVPIGYAADKPREKFRFGRADIFF